MRTSQLKMAHRTRLLALGLSAIASVIAASELKHVNVFTAGQNGYFAYRIPAIQLAPDGSLVAFAEGRKYNLSDPGFGKQEIHLVMKRSSDGGASWSAMKIIERPGEFWSAANPATLADRQTGRVWLFYLRCKPQRNTETARPGTDDNQVLARWSGDNGSTWSEPMDLTGISRDMVDPAWKSSVVGPGGAIQDRTGRLIAPVWKLLPWGNLVIYSENHGRTWQRGGFIPGTQGGDENQLVELADGRLLMDIRQNSGSRRWRSTSSDGGKTWSERRPGVTVTPVACAIERLTLKSAGDDRDRLVWTGPKGPGRKNLVARISYDEGESFVSERLIYHGEAAYSDLTLLKDGAIGVLWERDNYRFITFTRLELSWLEPKPD
jgi:sialidase-1